MGGFRAREAFLAVVYGAAALVAMAVVALGGVRGFEALFAAERPAAPASPTVARLDGEPISARDVLIQLVLMDTVPDIDPARRRQALDALVRNRLIVREAERLGIGAPRSQVEAMAEQHRRLYRSGSLPEQDAIRALLAALAQVGVDEEAYWTQVAPEQYLVMLDAAALQKRLAGDGDLSAQAGAMAQLLDRLLKAARLQIVDPSFFSEK